MGECSGLTLELTARSSAASALLRSIAQRGASSGGSDAAGVLAAARLHSLRPCALCRFAEGATLPCYDLAHEGVTTPTTAVSALHASCAVRARVPVEQWGPHPRPSPGHPYAAGGLVPFMPRASPGVSYCACRDGDDERLMMACDGCSEWYHAACEGVVET